MHLHMIKITFCAVIDSIFIFRVDKRKAGTPFSGLLYFVQQFQAIDRRKIIRAVSQYSQRLPVPVHPIETKPVVIQIQRLFQNGKIPSGSVNRL